MSDLVDWRARAASLAKANQNLRAEIADMKDQSDRIEALEADVDRLNREADLQAAEIDKTRARADKWQSMVLDCEKYLKPGETPRQRMDRDAQDVLGLMRLLQIKSEKQEAAEAALAEKEAEVARLRHKLDRTVTAQHEQCPGCGCYSLEVNARDQVVCARCLFVAEE